MRPMGRGGRGRGRSNVYVRGGRGAPANVWRRGDDATGTGSATPAAPKRPLDGGHGEEGQRDGKRARPGAPTGGGGGAVGGAQQDGHHQPAKAPVQAGQLPKVDAAAATAAAKLRAAEEEATALKQKIQAREDRLKEAKERLERKQREEAKARAQEEESRNKRAQKLSAGFAMAVERAEAERTMRRRHEKGGEPSDEDKEVERVLAAGSDFECLRVQPGAPLDAVRKSYRALAKVLHPDKCKSAGATDAFRRISQAYENLCPSGAA